MNKGMYGNVTNNGVRREHRGCGWGNLSEREYLEDPGLDVKVILDWVFRKQNGGVDCIDLAQKWRAFVNTVTNHWVS
jgi:hypothetical protein